MGLAPWNRVCISILAKLAVLPVYAGCLAGIFSFLIISMSRIGADCITVFHLENMDFIVGVVSMSYIIAGCTNQLSTPK
jgi:hypothetical protein